MNVGFTVCDFYPEVFTSLTGMPARMNCCLGIKVTDVRRIICSREGVLLFASVAMRMSCLNLTVLLGLKVLIKSKEALSPSHGNLRCRIYVCRIV